MSCNYADGLSAYANKGKCGLPERFDDSRLVEQKVAQLADMLLTSRHVVVFTGAGVSTAAGIADFRGPRGVWTLQESGETAAAAATDTAAAAAATAAAGAAAAAVPHSIDWLEARPTATHMALAALVDCGRVQLVVSQNVDALHMRSGLARARLAELHGNVLVHRCAACRRQFVRAAPVPSVGERCLQLACPSGQRQQQGQQQQRRGGPCRGRLYDTVLDWEAELPALDLQLAELHSQAADLVLVLGTSLQMQPCADLPLLCKRRRRLSTAPAASPAPAHGRLVICNLQRTKHDRRADLCIAARVDDVMCQLLQRLDLALPAYDPLADPTCRVASDPSLVLDWTLPEDTVRQPDLLQRLADVKRQQRSKQQQQAPQPQLQLSRKAGSAGKRCVSPTGDPDGSSNGDSKRTAGSAAG